MRHDDAHGGHDASQPGRFWKGITTMTFGFVFAHTINPIVAALAILLLIVPISASEILLFQALVRWWRGRGGIQRRLAMMVPILAVGAIAAAILGLNELDEFLYVLAASLVALPFVGVGMFIISKVANPYR